MTCQTIKHCDICITCKLAGKCLGIIDVRHNLRTGITNLALAAEDTKLAKQKVTGVNMEKDPSGKDQHEAGAKLDAGKRRDGLVLLGFSRALAAVSAVGTYGANKYRDNGWMSVPNGVNRYTDAMLRHILSEASGELTDKDTGLLHAAHAAWNALARLDLMIRESEQ